jgi:hypothetical protein
MKAAVLLVISEGLLILAVILVCSGLKGSVAVNFGWPVSQFALTTNAEAHGVVVALALIAVIGAAVTLVAGLVTMMKTSRMSA